MRNFFDNLRYRFQEWMTGRYGADELNRLMMIGALVFFIASLFSGKVGWLRYMIIPGLVLVIFATIRQFSRNVYARSKERDAYLRIKQKITGFFKLQKRMWSERKTHRYYRCPKCHVAVRVPKGRGKIQITCPKCREKFIKTT